MKFTKKPKGKQKSALIKLEPLQEIMLAHGLISMGFDPYGEPVDCSTDVFQLSETKDGRHSFTFLKTGYRVEWERPNFGMHATHNLSVETLAGHIRLCTESVQAKRNQML